MNKLFTTKRLNLSSYFAIVFFSSVFSILNVIAQATTVTFAYTGAAQTFTVPVCVTSISVDVRGAKGGGVNGGNGGKVTHPSLTVTPGQILQINVGGMGGTPTAGWNGGGVGANAAGACGVVPSCGGGGASDIRIGTFTLANRIIVAGGGGGRNGGSTNVAGGAGGCTTGSAGTASFGGPGGGGTQATGGAGGTAWGSGAVGQAGSLGQGGNGAADPCFAYGPGGAGGGGYYGGGGGGSDCFSNCSLGGGGGGGGSSLTPAGGVCTSNSNAGNGIVTITYIVTNPVVTASNTGPYCAGNDISLNSPAGAIDYDWTGPGGFVQNDTQNPTIVASTTLMAGTYSVLITMPGGCTATATTTVVVNPLPLASATNTGPYCYGETIQLNSPNGAATDDWTGPGYIQNNVQNPTILNSTVAMSGVYAVTVTNALGCSASASTTVLVNELPIPTAANTGPYCEGDVVIITSSGGVDYDWTGPNGFILNNTQNTTIPSALMGMNGTYTVTVTNASNCVATASMSILVNLLPIPTASNTGPYCEGELLSLNSSGGTGYAWIGPDGYTSTLQNPTIPTSTLANAGNYNVTVSSSAGCTATKSTTVIITALPLPTASNTGPYCEGERVDLSSTGGVVYLWNGPKAFISSTQNPNISSSIPANSGTYTVTVTDGVGCSASTETIVVVYATPTAVPLFTPQNPTTLNPKVEFYDASFSDIVSWNWEIDGLVYNTANFIHDFTTSGNFEGILRVTNQYGCFDTTSFAIYVKPEISIYIPNSFTPNGDGKNEILFVYGTNWSRIEFAVFDRWGNEVFYSNEPEKGWDGSINNNGDKLQSGAYTYKVNIIDFYGKEHTLMGFVNLMK